MRFAKERWINELVRSGGSPARRFPGLRSRSAAKARRAHAAFPYTTGLATMALVSAARYWFGPERKLRRHARLRDRALRSVERSRAALQAESSLASRLAAAGGGLALIGLGARQEGHRGLLPALAGLVLLERGLRFDPRRLLRGRAIRLANQIDIDAPIEEVFAFWSVIENFPRFMSHVREVARIGPSLYHWEVDGPAGVSVGWDAELSAFTPPRTIAWRSVRGSAIETSGGVRFERRRNGRTRVLVHLRYTPPAGALGHAFAGLLGADPMKAMDDDLLRFKTLLEKGRIEGRDGAVTRAELEPSTLAEARRDLH